MKFFLDSANLSEIKEASEEQTIFSKATDKLKDAFKSLKGGVKIVINSFNFRFFANYIFRVFEFL